MISEATNTTNIFIPSSFGGRVAASNDLLRKNTYYRQLVYPTLARGVTNERLDVLARQLAWLARTAQATRRPDDVENIRQLLLALPLPKSLQGLTYYYEGLRLGRAGQFNAAEQMLHRATEGLAPEYRPRVFQEIGCSHERKNDIDAAIPFFVLAGKLGRENDPLVFLQSQQIVGSIQAANGDYRWAVKSVESIFPAVLAAAKSSPLTYFEYLNNYSVRLGEVGRVDEANAALTIALNSRYAPAFPEWAETRAELETKRRHPRPSFVAIGVAVEHADSEQGEPYSPPSSETETQPPNRITRALHLLAALLGLLTLPEQSIATLPPVFVIAAWETAPFIMADWPSTGPRPRAPPSRR